jgi:hypothetical protein
MGILPFHCEFASSLQGSVTRDSERFSMAGGQGHADGRSVRAGWLFVKQEEEMGVRRLDLLSSHPAPSWLCARNFFRAKKSPSLEDSDSILGKNLKMGGNLPAVLVFVQNHLEIGSLTAQRVTVCGFFDAVQKWGNSRAVMNFLFQGTCTGTADGMSVARLVVSEVLREL